MMLYAQVIVRQKGSAHELTYAVPETILPYLKVGSLVNIPLRKKVVEGLVVAFRSIIPLKLKGKIRNILTMEKDHSNPKTIELIKRLTRYYGSSLSTVAFFALKYHFYRKEKSDNQKDTSLKKPVFIEGVASKRFKVYRNIIKNSDKDILCLFAQKDFASSFFKMLDKSLSATLIDDKSPIVLFDDKSSIVLFDASKRSQKELKQLLEENNRVVIISTLMGAFLPIRENSIMILDQSEHDGAKSNQRPFMSFRKIADIRSMTEKHQIIMGSTLINFNMLLKARSHSLIKRIAESAYKPITLYSQKMPEIFDEKLIALFTKKIEIGAKLLLMAFSKGWSSALICQDCGQIVGCPQCAKTISTNQFGLVCKYCHYKAEMSKYCLKCRSVRLREIGSGSEKVISLLKKVFPTIDVSELSGDKVIDRSAQITVATEKVFSFYRWHFDSAVILNADRFVVGSHLDSHWQFLYYLAELQDHCSDLTVVTSNSDHQIWNYLTPSGRRHFFAKELMQRKQTLLPPYGTIFKIVGIGAKKQLLENQSHQIADIIAQINSRITCSAVEIIAQNSKNIQCQIDLYYPYQLSDQLKSKISSILAPNWHLNIDF